MDSTSEQYLGTVVAIDDDETLLEAIREGLAEDGLEVLTCSDPQRGLELVFSRHPEVVLLDLIMPGVSGMDLLERIVQQQADSEVILMTGHYSTDSAVEAVQKGASDYLPKPVPLAKLRERVHRVLLEARRRRETLELDRKLLDVFQMEGIVGRSPAMIEMFDRIRRVAPHFRTVLISGATGTGKELVARALHKLSGAPSSPFAVCNCAAIVETLFESELFGYTKGAFTGATQDKVGLFEYANGGTILLDEIGEMPLASQAKLLRVLQQQEVHRVGSPMPRKVDVRVIAATNRDLRKLVSEQKFREDLYYRLSMVSLRLPSLAERREDLPLLQRHFVELFAEQYGKPVCSLTRRAQSLLSHYEWPGNVREMENILGQAVMLSERDVIDVEDIQPFLRTDVSPRSERGSSTGSFTCSTDLPLADVEKSYIAEVLAEEDGNVVRTARRLGVPRSTLYQRLKELPPADRQPRPDDVETNPSH